MSIFPVKIRNMKTSDIFPNVGMIYKQAKKDIERILDDNNIGYCVYSDIISYNEPIYNLTDNNEIFDYILRKLHSTININSYDLINIHTFKNNSCLLHNR